MYLRDWMYARRRQSAAATIKLGCSPHTTLEVLSPHQSVLILIHLASKVINRPQLSVAVQTLLKCVISAFLGGRGLSQIRIQWHAAERDCRKAFGCCMGE